ncbi:M23 family metallopeptidase [Pigmentiphaga aceris]|uniref:M23 family metallopeptidase n=1 Tax=Pigmentiphaga aceris TaxID=1940612 RepID=A0A5C0B4L4_9BURK|nr:M23 family metallopeptidase [Pigmentiphaga aceris]QEI07467.1 M23 family metallopeptidase [Pigmentiphaga aceris]
MRSFVALIATLVIVILVGVATWPWLGPKLDYIKFAIQLSSSAAPDSVAVPVAGVMRRNLVDTWGGARSGGRRHEGIDIFASRGTAVIAATDGLVARIGENRLGGRTVWVYGPGRQRHYYAHLDRYAEDLSAGDRVAVGDVLGYVGDSGNARGTPPHLHYGIYTMSGAINPYPLLKALPPTAPATPTSRQPASSLPASADSR